jgi:hypothetical protein
MTRAAWDLLLLLAPLPAADAEAGVEEAADAAVVAVVCQPGQPQLLPIQSKPRLSSPASDKW